MYWEEIIRIHQNCIKVFIPPSAKQKTKKKETKERKPIHFVDDNRKEKKKPHVIP